MSSEVGEQGVEGNGPTGSLSIRQGGPLPVIGFGCGLAAAAGGGNSIRVGGAVEGFIFILRHFGDGDGQRGITGQDGMGQPEPRLLTWFAIL